MKDKHQAKTVSPQKIEANRQNAKQSTGPRTPQGKQRASQNSYQHGFYGLRLFPNNEARARDGSDYRRIFAAHWRHYAPVGDLEKLSVEKITMEALRLARLIGHEQQVLAFINPFEERSVDKIVRYEANISRQMEKAINRLEHLQQERKGADFESDDATDEATDERSEVPDGLIPEGQPSVSSSINVPNASVTTAPPQRETGVKEGSAPTDEDSLSIEQATDPTPAGQHNSGLGSGEDYETDSIGSSRWIETAEDAELIGRIKREATL